MKSFVQALIATISLILVVGNTQGSHIASGQCDNSELFTQLLEITSENQKLTQHVLELTDRYYNLELKLSKYAAYSKKVAYLATRENNKMKRSSKDVSHDNEWIVIQRRKDGTENFYRPWEDYKTGFGYKTREFFIGLEKLHELTTREPHELLIVMEDWDYERRYAKYDRIVIGSESEKYVLKELGDYSGTAGDSLSYHLGMKFSTMDQENDVNPKEDCAVQYTGAWWYNACHRSNLNGRYLHAELSENDSAQGINWNSFRGLDYSLKFVEMRIRPIRN